MAITKLRNLPFASLSLSWSVSKGRDTYGYNICRLDDDATGQRYKTMGGGYDMRGTVLGQWLEDVMQEELMAIAGKAYYQFNDDNGLTLNQAGLYGMHVYRSEQGEAYKISIDGACGVESVIKIAEAIGLHIEPDYKKKRGVNNWELAGWIVHELPKAE